MKYYINLLSLMLVTQLTAMNDPEDQRILAPTQTSQSTYSMHSIVTTTKEYFHAANPLAVRPVYLGLSEEGGKLLINTAARSYASTTLLGFLIVIFSSWKPADKGTYDALIGYFAGAALVIISIINGLRSVL